MNPFQFTRVTTPKAAISAITKESGTYFLAGGTNLIDLMKREVIIPERLVDINKLPLATIEKTATGLRIGAMAKNSDRGRQRAGEEALSAAVAGVKRGSLGATP